MSPPPFIAALGDGCDPWVACGWPVGGVLCEAMWIRRRYARRMTLMQAPSPMPPFTTNGFHEYPQIDVGGGVQLR